MLQDEQRKGLALINTLDAAQRQKAIIAVSKTGNHNVGEAFKDNLVLDYAGIRATELTAPQQEQLLDVIGAYVRRVERAFEELGPGQLRLYRETTGPPPVEVIEAVLVRDRIPPGNPREW